MEMFAFPSNMDEYVASGALVKMDVYPAGGQGTIVYFNCDDCPLKNLVWLTNVKIEQPKTSLGEFDFIYLIVDIERNNIGLNLMR